MKTDKKGCSTCPAGKESYEKYWSKIESKYLYQYDYRNETGKLFSCVSDSLEKCRARRDAWNETIAVACILQQKQKMEINMNWINKLINRLETRCYKQAVKEYQEDEYYENMGKHDAKRLEAINRGRRAILGTKKQIEGILCYLNREL